MIIGYLLITFLLLLFLGYYYLVLAPKRLLRWQAQVFRQRGYKVLELPYDLLNSSYFKLRDENNTKDNLGFLKEEAPKVDVMVVNLGNHIIAEIANNIELTQDLLSNQKTAIYQKHPLFVNSYQKIAGMGLAFAEGETWKKKRKILTQLFNFQFIKLLTPKIANICDRVLDEIESKVSKNAKSFQYNVFSYGVRVASNSVIECFFRKKLQGEKIQDQNISFFLSNLIDETTQMAFDNFVLLFGIKFINWGLRKKDRQLSRKLRIYNAWGRKMIRERIQQVSLVIERGESFDQPKDLIEALLINRAREGQSSVYNDEQAIFDEFNTFFLAGTDTTSYFLTTMIYLIALHPKIQEKVRKQIDIVMKDDDFSYENLKNCTYIDCVQKETTRYYGPVNGIYYRYSSKDTWLKDVPIHRGVQLGIQPLAFHYSEQYYKDPQQFRPERWQTQCDNIPTFAVGGFSGGARTCIGKHFAKIQAKIGLIKFMKRYKKIKLPCKQLSFVQSFIYQPKSIQSILKKS